MAEPGQTSTDDQAGVDRRRMLRDAVAVGAVAWTAPQLISSSAHAANGICTAKCAAVPTVCFQYLRTSRPGPCTTWVMNGMTLMSNQCPCSSTRQVGCLILPPQLVFGSGNQGFTVAVNTTTGAFTASGLPADGNLSWTATTSITARAACPDRAGGDLVWTTCRYVLTIGKDGCDRTLSLAKTCDPVSTSCLESDPCNGVRSRTLTVCSENDVPRPGNANSSVIVGSNASISR